MFRLTSVLSLALVSVCALPSCAQTARPSPSQDGDLEAGVAWIGNSFGSGRFTSGKWVQNTVSDLWVSPDGRCYTVSSWDEGKREAGIYQNGDIVGALRDLHPREGGAGGTHQSALSSDGKFVYVALRNRVRRYDLGGKHAPFEGGTGKWKNEIALSRPDAQIAGLSADAKSGRLYATDRKNGRVEAFDLKTMQPAASWELPRAFRVAVASDGSVWVIQKAAPELASEPVLGNRPDDEWNRFNPTGSGQILHFSPDGKPFPEKITGVSGFTPVALHFDGKGRLMVADNGPDQNLKIYDVAGAPKLVDSFGIPGGVFLDGKYGPQKFVGLVGFGIDEKGQIYLAQNRFGPEINGSEGGGMILEAYANTQADAKPLWRLESLEFVDGGAFVPGSDGAQVLSKYTRYELDPAKDGNIGVARAHTLNQFRYPLDPRFLRRRDYSDFSTAFLVRELAGKRFLINAGMWGKRLEIYRFEGEVAVPCGYVTTSYEKLANAPQEKGFIWRDENGDGAPQSGEFQQQKEGFDGAHSKAWWVDESGDLWQGAAGSDKGFALRRLPFGGLNKAGAPIWNYDNAEVSSEFPAPFNALYRVVYDPQSDTMLLSGYTTENPFAKGGNPKYIGSTVAVYDGWRRGDKKLRWSVGPPYKAGPTSLAVAGDYLFIAYDYRAEGKGSGAVRVYRLQDGAFVGTLSLQNGESGRVDVSYGIAAHRRSDGEYWVLVEEDWHARLVLYRWRPPA